MARQPVLAPSRHQPRQVVPALLTASLALAVKFIQLLNDDCAPVYVPRKTVFVPIRNLL